MIRISRVKNKRELNDFIKFPYKIYKNDKNWTPPLISDQIDFFNPKKNPFFEHADVELFLAFKDNDLAGRIAAIVNYNHIDFHNEKAGFFGFFESINDFDVTKGLFESSIEWLKDKGMEIVRGPMNFSTNDECGLLIEGFNESPMIMMPYNPEYYIDLIERYGFLKAMDLYAYSLKGNPPERLIRFFNKISDKTNIKIRKIDMKRFYEEIDRIMDIYNSAWEKNWGFIPLTDKEIRYHAIRLKKIADPNLILFAEVDNTHVGFISAIPNINPVLKKINGNLFPFGIFKYIYYSRKIDSVRVITLGIIRDYRNMGIDSLLILELWKRGIDGGYRFGEMSWILESNILMRRGIEKIGGLPYKRYRIYELKL